MDQRGSMLDPDVDEAIDPAHDQFASRCRRSVPMPSFSARAILVSAVGWLDRIDPGAHRRIKGIRLVTAYGIAAMLGTMADIARGLSNGAALSSLAGEFALWASVSEGRSTRFGSTRDLLLLSAAAAMGAASYIGLAPLLECLGRAGPELQLSPAELSWSAICGASASPERAWAHKSISAKLLAYGARLGIADLPTVAVAGLLAALASVVPRLLSGPAEHPPPVPALLAALTGAFRPELIMGLQAAIAGIVIVALNAAVGLTKSAWAITACTYVVAGSANATIDRVKRRIVGTALGVPLGLVCLPLATCAARRLGSGSTGNGSLCDGSAGALRYRLRRLRLHFDRHTCDDW